MSPDLSGWNVVPQRNKKNRLKNRGERGGTELTRGRGGTARMRTGKGKTTIKKFKKTLLERTAGG